MDRESSIDTAKRVVVTLAALSLAFPAQNNVNAQILQPAVPSQETESEFIIPIHSFVSKQVLQLLHHEGESIVFPYDVAQELITGVTNREARGWQTIIRPTIDFFLQNAENYSLQYGEPLHPFGMVGIVSNDIYFDVFGETNGLFRIRKESEGVVLDEYFANSEEALEAIDIFIDEQQSYSEIRIDAMDDRMGTIVVFTRYDPHLYNSAITLSTRGAKDSTDRLDFDGIQPTDETRTAIDCQSETCLPFFERQGKTTNFILQ